MNEKICRLCLQTISIISNNNCEAVGESMSKTLKLNLKISKESVMCFECAACLQVFSKRTAGCLYIGDGTVPLSDPENGGKLNQEPPSETTSNPKSLMETKIKCNFCTKTHGREDLISLQISKENKFLLEQYISETNFNNTEELLTCETCLEALEGVLSVILKCLEVEKKIHKYIKLKGTDDEGQIELKDVQQFMFGPILRVEIESVGVSQLEGRFVRIQEVDTATAQTEMKYEKEIRHPELIIKSDDDDNNIQSEQSACDITDAESERSDCDGLQEPFIENKIPSDPLPPSVVTSGAKKCKERINQRLLTHKISSKRETFYCSICSYKTKHKGFLEKHLLIHKRPFQTFKCASCSYEAKHKSHLQRHLLTHKSPSEMRMFKCASCPYEAKRKDYLQMHLLTHKSPSEIRMFKCELCSYEAKNKSHLQRHLLTHKSRSEIRMFKCASCSYEAKHKFYLQRHLLTHKSPSEITMFKCASCSYEAKRKEYLRKHLLLTHKSPSEITMFKCASCSYETKRKEHLRTHLLLTHKSPSEIRMFKCASCSHEAKNKFHLQRHLLTHKSPSEIRMFKCALCPYESKRKDSLERHILIHKNPSEITMFKCASCPYEAKRKYHLEVHLTTH